MLSWTLTDLYCNTIARFDQRKTGSKVTVPFMAGRTATLVLSTEQEHIERIEPLKTALYAEYEGIPVFHGPVLEPVFKGSDGTIEVPAVDPVEWLNRGFYHLAVAYANWAQEDIVWDAVKNRYVDYVPSMDLYLARVILAGITYANILRSYNVDAGRSAMQPITDICALNEGPEWELQPLPPDQYYDRGDGSAMQRCAAWARLLISPTVSGIGTSIPRQIGAAVGTSYTAGAQYRDPKILLGAQPITPEGAVEFEYGFGQDNCLDMTFNPHGGQVKNWDFVTGQIDSASGYQPSGLSDMPNSRDEYGTWEGWESTSFADDAGCKAAAVQQVSAYGVPPHAFTVVPAMEWMNKNKEGGPYGHPPQFLIDYGVGSVISAEGQYGTIRQKAIGRVTQAEISEVDSDANVKVSLTAIPTVTAEGVT